MRTTWTACGATLEKMKMIPAEELARDPARRTPVPPSSLVRPDDQRFGGPYGETLRSPILDRVKE